MTDNIIAYIEMCRREGTSLQQGMNFGLGGNYSVILMSARRNAPYRDRLEDGGTTLIYKGHDEPRRPRCPNPKVVDQPARYPSGGLTQNGKFHQAAQDAKAGRRQAERVRVYEKIHLAVWRRDGGKCVVCGSKDELHFDHDLPWSKGGTSLTEANVQLLCARHNLEKHGRII